MNRTPRIVTHVPRLVGVVAAILLLSQCTEYGAWDWIRRLSVDPWFDIEWPYRHRLSFDNGSRSEDLDDFPVLIRLNPSRVNYGDMEVDGADLRFVDAGGDRWLPYEFESWNPGGESLIWVRVPRINGVSDSDYIHLYYGNAAAAPAADPTGVWDAAFRGVWHLGDNADDSTAYAHHGVDSGAPAAGPVGLGRDLNGSQSILVADSNDLDLTGSLTMEAWAYKRISGQPQVIFGKSNSIGNQRSYKLEMDEQTVAADTITFWITNDGAANVSGRLTTVTPQVSGVWYYVTGVKAGVNLRLYINGRLDVQMSTDQNPVYVTTEDLAIGQQIGPPGEYLDGTVDEIRLSSVARSADWISAQYASMTDGFISWGERESQWFFAAMVEKRNVN